MTGIFGIFVRDPSRVSADPKPEGHRPPSRFTDAAITLCADRERSAVPDRPFVLISNGMIHNRAELAADLGFGADLPPDQLLFEHAYARWGDTACEHIHGDWSFAAWTPAERKLTLARDHLGNTSLYYYTDDGVFAFATSLHQLLALGLAPIVMDELFLAQTLISWPAYHGERSIHMPMKRLPPAHVVQVTPQRLAVSQYWRLEDVREVRLAKRQDYVERFVELFDRAVRERIRDGMKVAATLSGGLDSSSVSATAALALGERGARLSAYTSTPIADTEPYVGARFGDEYPLALATAEAADNIDLHRVDAAQVSPIASIREMIEISLEPQHAAGNLFWIMDLYRDAARDGNAIVLTGQLGNAGVSWTGGQPLRQQIASVGLMGTLRRRVRGAFSPAVDLAYRRWRYPRTFDRAAIAPDFADRIKLAELRCEDPSETPHLSARDTRFAILKPGASKVGALHAEMGAAAGVAVSDPTGDARLLEFCLSVPDRIFVDPETGIDRWLIREAMRGRVPDPVRLNRDRGRQAGDLVPRLRAHADEVDAAIEEIRRGPGAAYLDMAKLDRVWRQVRAESTPDSFQLAVTVLTRGIMAGLFVNGVGRPR
jgi:asparagine synthase (glutamine-hydrolysing)